VTQTTVAPGAINHLNVALLLDKSVPASEVAAVKAAVSNMVGLTPSRGDTLSVSQLAFAKPSAFSPSSGGLPIVGGSPIGVAKTAVIGLAAIVFFFLARRNLRKKEGEAVAPEPKWLREIQQTMPIAQLAPAVPDHPMTDRRRQVQSTAEEIVRNQPEQVAIQVAQWMSE
jgi:flagellar M-ring protein FliF